MQYISESQKMPFIIRVPVITDAARALAYIRDVCGETEFLNLSPEDIKFSLKEEKEYLEKMTTGSNSMLFIAEIKGEIAGIVSINGVQTIRRRHIGILGLSVKKECWNRGIGTALLEKILGWVKENTLLKKIMLHVHEKNDRAIRLYRKYGFIQEGLLRMDRYTGGEYHNTIVMGLMLD
ncbi:MAG: GNAT family N-acetyltransferase [Spirochaetales bacterium]|nr:GNAT family N-acetyltransferase [Spirochaetales bacterium]